VKRASLTGRAARRIKAQLDGRREEMQDQTSVIKIRAQER
jgi:hypothetical protein